MSAYIFRSILRYNSLLLIKWQCYNIALGNSKNKRFRREDVVMEQNEDQVLGGLQGDYYQRFQIKIESVQERERRYDQSFLEKQEKTYRKEELDQGWLNEDYRQAKFYPLWRHLGKRNADKHNQRRKSSKYLKSTRSISFAQRSSQEVRDGWLTMMTIFLFLRIKYQQQGDMRVKEEKFNANQESQSRFLSNYLKIIRKNSF